MREAIEQGKPVPADLGPAAAAKLLPVLDLDDERTQELSTHVDDEYAYAGVIDPKVVLTTSRSPSSRLTQFSKELRLLIPGCQRVNRGGYIVKDLVDLCKSNDVTDLLIVREHRGQPDGLTICHLPHGPTAHFSLSDVALRHDLPEKPSNMSEALPHLVMHNFTSKVGIRVANILKYLFPPSVPSSRRVHSFTNVGDIILFRHHTWEEPSAHIKRPAAGIAEDSSSGADKAMTGSKGLRLTEIGPRFTLKLFRIELGTVEMKDLEAEWALRPYFTKPKAALS